VTGPFQDQEGYLLLGQNELSEQLMRALELKGDLPRRIDPRYQVGINALDLTTVEFNWLRRTRQYFFTANQAAVAANIVRIFGQLNPVAPESSALVVIEGFYLNNFTAAALTYRVGISTSLALLGAGVPGIRDTRQTLGGLNSTLLTATAQSVVNSIAVPSAFIISVPAGSSVWCHFPQFVITSQVSSTTGNPHTFIIENDAVNQPIIGGFWWRERSPLSSER